MTLANEVGRAPPRGRPRISREDAARVLSEHLGEPIELSETAVVFGSVDTCPACGSGGVMWGCDPTLAKRTRDEVHPLVWDEVDRMADSFVCRACDAGWIEPDDPEPITWVRPYWRVPPEAK